jgi:hypothetical protein
MANQIRLRVEVIEVDDDGQIVSSLCSYAESYGEGFFKHPNNRSELVQFAYEGFVLATNKFVTEFSQD